MESKRQVFFRRLGASASLWALVAVAVWVRQDWIYGLLIGGVALLALWEFYAMVKAQGSSVFPVTGLLCAAGYLLASYWFLHNFDGVGVSMAWFDMLMLPTVVFVVFLRQMARQVEQRTPLEAIAYTIFGFLYIPWMFNFLAKIMFLYTSETPEIGEGLYYVLFLIVVTKFSDMGAYAFGSLFGKHKLVPHISPHKTWEGFFGALFSAFLGGYAVYALAGERIPLLNFGEVVFLSLVLGMAAVLGDLAESVLKRSAQIKDSSSVLPGIGGTLDLIDSLLFTAPIFFFYLCLFA